MLTQILCPLLFIAFSLVVFLLVGHYAQRRFGSEGIRSRFPEREAYDWTKLRDLAVAEPGLASFYICPVLFPLDLLAMLLLAGSTAVASMVWLQAIGYQPGWGCVLPGVYLAADLIEDTRLASLLRTPASITEDNVRRLKSVTSVKMWTVKLAGLQVVVLLVWRLFM